MSRREPTQGGPALRVPIGVFLVVVVVVGALWVTTNKAAASVVFTEPANAPSPRPGFLPPSTVTAIARTPVHTIGHVVSGDTVGLYGGGESNTCDAAAIGAFLAANPAMALAWAQALLIPPSDISLYLASFTALTLRTDTAVTNHGYENGAATPFQSVLQAGTAVLVDAEGLPRVRCHCGNPLQLPAPPEPESEPVSYEGPRWAGFEPESVTVINPAPTEITDFVVLNEQTNSVVERPRSTDGPEDRPVDPVVDNMVRANFFVNGSGGPRTEAPSASTSPSSTELTESASAAYSVRSRSVTSPSDATTSPAEDLTLTGTTTPVTAEPGNDQTIQNQLSSSTAESEKTVTTTTEPVDTATTTKTTTTATTTKTTTKPPTKTTTTKPPTKTKTITTKPTTTTTKPTTTTTKPTTTTTTRKTPTSTTTTYEVPPEVPKSDS